MQQELINKKKKLAVLGLGYVGLPIALEFARNIQVIGFDINEDRLQKTVSYTHSDAADERSSVDLGGRRIIKKKKKIIYDNVRECSRIKTENTE